MKNGFNRLGYDHVLLVKIASTAVATQLLGGSSQQIMNALSQAFLDGAALRTYRHAPNTGSRKSWAAGDAASRGVRLALLAMQGEMGYPKALTAPQWGFYEASFQGQPFKLSQPYRHYVMDHILFKISFPAEFHAQTAVEAAVLLHPSVKNRLEEIETIIIQTQAPAIRIIDKKGTLYNPADRDHCLQYMTAIGLIFGILTATHYEDGMAKDPRIDCLREKMQVTENKQFSKDYLDPQKRSIANSVQVLFSNGTKTEEIKIEYPIGHPRRRHEAIPLLWEKFNKNVRNHFDSDQADDILTLCQNKEKLSQMPVKNFLHALVKK